MPEAHVILQCRLASSRLPGKALLPVAGLPAIVLCAQRATNRGGKLLAAISDDPSDDVLSAVLERHGVPFFRGPLADVLGRFYLATRNLADDAMIVRLTGDNLVPDEDFVGEMLAMAKQQRPSYLGTDSPLDRLPYGLAAEVFPAKLLRQANAAATSSFDREHVTPWIRRHVELRGFTPKALDRDFSHLRCTLDDFDDYLRLLALFRRVQDPAKAGWLELVQALAELPGEPRCRVPFRIREGVVHSELTLGTAQLGMPYGIANQRGMPSESDGFAIIRTAVASGVTSVDTARGYGEAERRLGLAGSWKERISIITKLDPEMEKQEGRRALRATVDASVFRSCAELRLPRLDTMLLHRWPHRHLGGGAVWERLRELRQEGWIGHLGASLVSTSEAREAFDDPEVEHVQLPFNLLDWRWKRAGIDRMAGKRKDVIVHARSALLQGLLGSDAARWPATSGEPAAAWVHKVNRLAQEMGRQNVRDLCLAYVRSQGWITSVVVGCETLEQLQDNLRLFQGAKLSEPECARIEEELAGASEALLDPSRWAEACQVPR